MAETLIFLGSGASVPFKLPTMMALAESFESYLKRQVEDNLSRTILYLYEDVITKLKQVYGYVDVESAFAAVDVLARNIKYEELGVEGGYMISKLGRDIIKDNRITTNKESITATKLLGKFKEFVKDKCTLNHTYDPDIIIAYDNLFKKMPNDFLRIYTTNYDTVLETYWEGKEQIMDLFVKKAMIEELDISQLNYGGRIRLIKLHGSTNWYKLQSGKIVKSDTQRIRIGGEIVEGELMIYPISQKNLYLYPWLDFIKQFKNDLRL